MQAEPRRVVTLEAAFHMNRIKCSTIAFTLMLPVCAQEITGNIAGTVTDPTGASVLGVTVIAKRTQNNQEVRRVTTGGQGEYSLPLLPVGRYEIAFEAPGFRRFVQTGVEVNVNDRLTVNASLELGAATEQVTVAAASQQIELQNSAQQSLVTGTQVRELALVNRNFTQLVAIVPGVTSGSGDQPSVGVSSPAGTSNLVNYSVNGLRASQNNWTVDGADNLDRGSNVTLLTFPSIDAITEFRVQRSNYSAEFGRAAGGQINLITRSGTSAFHGDAYEFFRNDLLNANTFFNNARGIPRPAYRYNDFGYTVGGPVYIPRVYNSDRSRTFFFLSQEFRRVVQASTLTPATLPTQQLLAGNFPSPVCVQFSGQSCTQVGTQVTAINPAAQAYIQNVFSRVPAAGPDFQLFSAPRGVFDQTQTLARVDQTITQKLTVFARFLQDRVPTQEPGGLFTGSSVPGVSNTQTKAPGRSWVVRANWTIRPTWITDIGYSYSYGGIRSTITGLIGTAANSINIPLPFPSTLTRLPSLSFAGGGSSITGFGPYFMDNKNNQIFGNSSLILGTHTLRFGGTYYRYQKRENSGGSNAGSFSFASTGVPAGGSQFLQSWANFLLGNVASFSQAQQDIIADIRANQWETYLQDDWRVRPNLTLNLGIRYSYYGQPYDENNLLTNFDPALYNPAKAPRLDPATGLLVPGTGDPLNGIAIGGRGSRFGRAVGSSPNQYNWAPRVGFAWDPFNSGTTSVRAGYGIFWDFPLFGIYVQDVSTNPPFANTITIPNTRLENPGAGTALVNLAPPTLRGVPSDFATPYSQQWSVGVQHQLARNFIGDVSYVGTKGTHLIGIADINQPLPGAARGAGIIPPGGAFTPANTNLLNAVRPYQGYSAINVVEPWFNSTYHSLQVAANYRITDLSQIGLAYTWSKAITDNRSDRSSAPQDTYDFRKGERGLAQFDRRHVLTINQILEIPVFRNRTGWVGAAFGGWEVSGIAFIWSGLPLNAFTALQQDPAGLGIFGGSVASQRPDWACNPNSGAPHRIDQWFNTSCLVNPPADANRPGNAGRSIIQGPRFDRWDVSLFKNFRLPFPGEQGRLQVRAESFNVFNSTIPFDVNTTLGSPTYGRVTTTRDPRNIQLAIKLYF